MYFTFQQGNFFFMTYKRISDENQFLKMLRILALAFSAGCFLFLLSLVFVAYFAFRAITDWNFIRPEKSVTSTFYEYTERMQAVTNLVLVERSNVETVERTFSRELTLPFFGKTLKSEAFLTIRCRVFYSYYVNLKGKWVLRLDGRTLYVKAPPLECLPPAIDTSRIERKTENGWLIFGEPELLKGLEKDLSIELYRKAVSAPSIQNITPEARKGLDEFIRKWVMYEKIQADNIVISFAPGPERKKL